MKLPTDKKERVKILLLVVFASIGILSATVQSLMGLASKKGELRTMIERLDDEIARAETDVRMLQRNRVGATAKPDGWTRSATNYLLRPVYVNYRLGAKAVLDPLAARLGLTLQSIEESGLLDVPRPGKSTTPAFFKVYAVRVSLECGYEQMLAFLKAIEESNPYLAIVSVYVAGQEEKDPETHRVVIGVQWPVWASEELKEQAGKLLGG